MFVGLSKHPSCTKLGLRHLSVLVMNCGSSSVKFKIIDTTLGQTKFKGQAENITGNKGKLTWEHGNKKKKISLVGHQYGDVIETILDLVKKEQFDFIGHRIVHGGELYTKPTILNKEMLSDLSTLSRLAPLHNPVQVASIARCLQIFDQIPQAGVFDTAYYTTMPQHAVLYPVPIEWYTKYGVRKYGFHGTSHYCVSRKGARYLKKPVENLNIVSCHLGSGCSVTATKGGLAIDTSMGFSPLSGIMMGTRSGDVDPSIIAYLEKQDLGTSDSIMDSLNKKSGLKGICGTQDSIEVENLVHQNDPRGLLGLEMFCYSAAKYVASFIVPLGSIDCLIFSGGIGENSPMKRERILQHLSGLGFTCDDEKNQRKGDIFSIENSGPRVLVVKTNEEELIADLTEQLFTNQPK